MNLLDRVISYYAPVAAVKRAQARLALDHVRAYEAAKVGRRTSGWKAPSTSPNAEIWGALERVRNRSRDMVRNNEYAARAINVLGANIVGTGIKVKMGNAQSLWNQFVDECDADGLLDLYGLQNLAVKTWKESGECLIRKRYRQLDDGFSVPLQFQVLEPDYLVNINEIAANGNIVIAGVEHDLLGRRVAYHMYRSHPGEVGIVSNLTRVRVPASDIIHLYRKDRPQQVRGMPALAVSMMRVRDLADYEDAELVRKKIEACFSVFVRTDDTTRSLGVPDTNVSDTRRVEKVSPGMIEYLKGTEEIVFANPQSNGSYGEYTQTQLHAIAVGTGVTYEQLTGDLKRVNFSSMRGGKIEFNSLIDQEQWLTFIPMFMKPVVRSFRDAALMAGKTEVRNVAPIYTTPKRAMQDPVKEVLATKEQLAAALISHSAALRELGYEPDDVYAEIASDAEKMKKLNISPDMTSSLLLKKMATEAETPAAAA